MIKIVFWSPILTKIVNSVVQAPMFCINLGFGIVSGAGKSLGVKILTKDSINEALSLKESTDACRNQLPIQLTTEHDEVAEIMTGDGRGAISTTKAVMKKTGIDKKCIAIFGLVCSKV